MFKFNKKITFLLFGTAFLAGFGFMFLFAIPEVQATTLNLSPNATGTYTNLPTQYPTSDSHWDKVDDPPGEVDENATYVANPNADQRKDAYNIQNTSQTGTINSVKVYYRVAPGPSNTAYAQPGLRLSSTEQMGTEQAVTGGATYTTYNEIISRPGGGNWSWTDINNLEAIIGLRMGTSVGIRCTAVVVQIDYTAVAAPTVTTQAATAVEETTSTFNGNITAIGSENPSGRGFNLGTASGVYTATSSEFGSFTTGAYTYNQTGLSPGTTYFYRAYATNTAGVGYGSASEQTFTTKPNPPTGLGETSTGVDSISVSWTKGSGAQNTMVRYKTGSYPSSTSDGSQCYFDTGNSCTASSLSINTTYYFRAWSYHSSGGYSDQTSDDTASTRPYASSGTLTSKNLLSGQGVSNINSFYYNASAIPTGTSLQVQFSRDNSSWYNATGTQGSWSAATTTGGSGWNLSSLNWSGPNFYYKFSFTSNGNNTSVVDDVRVNYSGLSVCSINQANGTCVTAGVGENGLPVCQECNGASTSPVNVADNTSDTVGNNVTATCQVCDGAGGTKNASNNTQVADCNSTCQACQSGVCSYANASTDPGNQCSPIGCAGGDYCSGTSASCGGAIPAGTDPNNYCTTASPGQPDSCKGANCDGSGSCQYLTAGEQSQPICKRCSGSSYNPVNVTNNTEDSEGSNTCSGTCQACQSGACSVAIAGTDPDSDCGTTECYTGNCKGGTAVCDYYTTLEHNCSVCKTCQGATSGSCSTMTNIQDSEGSSLCNSTCLVCSSGYCVVAGAGTDPGNLCGTTECYTGNCKGGTAVCDYYTTLEHNCTTACKTCQGATSGTCVSLTGYSEDSEGTYTCTTACKGCSSGSCVNLTSNTQDTYGSNTCSSGTCQACQSGSCSYADANTDPGDDCTTASPPLADSCKSNNCSGTGASCGYSIVGEQNQPACKKCSGSSYDPINLTDNTQDTLGVNLCNSTCQKCSSGSCVVQSAGEDLFTQCGTTECYIGYCKGGTAVCDYYTSGEHGCILNKESCRTCTGATSGSCVYMTGYTEDSEGSYTCNTACKGCSTGSCVNITGYNEDSVGTNTCNTACKGCSTGSCVNLTNNTQDTYGSNTCTATCKKCSSGSCVNQTVGEDWFNQCSIVTQLFLNSASGQSCNTKCATYSCKDGFCEDGTGACKQSACSCGSIGTDAGGTNGKKWALVGGVGDCFESTGTGCASTILVRTTECSGHLAEWTNCYCY